MLRTLYLLFLSTLCLVVFSHSSFAATTVPFTVNMSEVVNVTGTPRIAVNVGGVTRYATYASGTGTSALTFNYAMVAGDVDLDGVALTSPIDLNGGTLKDLNGNDATLTFTVPNTSGVKISYPSLSMDFTADSDGQYSLNGTTYSTLPSLLTATGGTFTRASVGTYFDSSGVMQTAASGTPRVDYNPITLAAKGILIEEARTNLNRYSEQVDNAIYNKRNCTVSANVLVGLDGTLSADKIIEDTGASYKELQIINASVSTASYTVSAFVKPSGRNYIYLYESQTEKSAVFDLLTGTVNGNYTGGSGSLAPAYGITSAGNGWYRIWMRWNATAGTISYIAFGLRNSTGNFNAGYVGDGASGVYIWGAQLEQGSFPTSYIPTTTTTVTRAADSLTIPTSGGWYNSSASSVFANFTTSNGGAGTYRRVIGTSGAANTNYGELSNADNYIRLYNNSAALDQASVNFLNGERYAASSSGTGRSLSVRGATTVTDFALVPSFTAFTLGSQNGSGNFLNGTIGKFKYYPARVTDTQLQLLSQ